MNSKPPSLSKRGVCTARAVANVRFEKQPTAWLLAAFMCALPVAAQTAPAFDSFVLDVGDGTGLVVLHGKLLADGRTDEIVVLGRSDDQRRLAVYSLPPEGAWQRVYDAEVDADVLFVDTVELGGQDRLLLYRRGSVDWLDFNDRQRKPLAAAPSLYNVPTRTVPHVDIGRDVNGDGLEDIAVPHFDGYGLWLQRPDGTLSERTDLPIAASARTNFEAASYRPRSLYSLDYDGDGISDLAVWDEQRFVVHRGKDDGSFHAKPLVASSPVPFDSDDIAVSFGFGDSEPVTMLYALKDFNGDGVGDLAATTTTVAGLFDQTTRYDFYFGRRAAGGTTFPAAPNTSIVSESVQAPFDAKDMDNDGKTDFGMGSFDIGIGMLIRFLLTGTVRFDLDFYVMREERYPERPNVTRPVKVRFSLASGDVLSGNWVELGDATGDGIVDLLALHDETRIDLYPGTGSDALFAERPVPIAVDLPERKVGPESVAVVDLNGDGRDDLLIEFAKRPGEDEPNRVGVVLSR